MIKKNISNGVAHKVPTDLRSIITSISDVHEVWEDITPLARNEWICWIESAKKVETRARRIKTLGENLRAGKRRPCCWAGCMHR
ncbi:MAG: YdeI/OmpD-associated family protein [Candidatus Paceibacterota bacterium]